MGGLINRRVGYCGFYVESGVIVYENETNVHNETVN